LVGDRYVLLGESRPGGLSIVRKAVDSADGEQVAIKFIAARDDRLTRVIFERETGTLKSLSHPNIIRLRDSGIYQKDGSFYIVLDWVDRSLADVLKESAPYEWNDLAATIAEPLTSALAYAHLKQVEHRDIKPSNVLVAEDGRPMLADFGIAKIRGDAESPELTVAGFRSGPYSPPENQAPVPYVRDVYSMGVLIIQAMHDAQIRDFHEVAPALDAIAVPPDVRRLLERCTSTDPTQRPANGSVLADDLRKVISESGARQSARRNSIWLKLTQSSCRRLVGEDAARDIARAGAVVLADLSGEVFAEFRFDHERNSVDRTMIFLAGNSWRLTLKPDETLGGFHVVNARELEFESLEGIRRRAMRVGSSLTWTCDRPRNPSAARRGLEALVRGLEDHRDARQSARDEAEDRDQQDSLFEDWLRLLDAREDLVRGERKPQPYHKCRVRGREAVFTLLEQTDLDLVGSELEVVIEASRRRIARGEVIAQSGSEVTLRSRRGFPSLPERATLAPYLGPTQIALQRQRDAVSAIRGETAARGDLRRIILDPTSVSAPDLIQITSWNRDLDRSKQAAVAAAIGAPDLLLVQGPPGTGKTSFIAETVSQFLKRRPDGRVLIVSQTHVAVDNALERLEAAGVERMVRLGLPDDPRVDRSVQHLLLDRQMSKWAASLRRKSESHLERRAKEAGISSHHLRAALALQRLVNIFQEISAVRARLTDGAASEGSSELAAGLGAEEDQAALQERLDGLMDQQRELLEEAQRELAGDLTLGPDISIEDARSAVDVLIGGTGPGRTLLRLLSLQAEWLQRVFSDRGLAPAFLTTTRVIAGTCIGFLGHGAVRNLDIDLCILDEASKATATEALVPMARAKRWLLVGDTRQLPPLDEEILRSPEQLNEYHLDAEFVQETLFQRMADRLPDHSRYLLREQYRMIRPIGDLVSTCFYDGQLLSPSTSGLRGYQVLAKPVLWLDTGTLGSRRREDQPSGSGTSYANRGEAQAVIDRLRTLDRTVANGLIIPPEDQQLVVLLIAPYRSQVDELRRRLARARIEHLNVSVQSVDAVQGREADIAFFSVTRSNSSGVLGFLGADYWRRINVALSRARFGLTIVGDAEFCRSAPGALKTVLDYIRAHPDDCELRTVEHA
jgi:serine/threonine protein kinase